MQHPMARAASLFRWLWLAWIAALLMPACLAQPQPPAQAQQPAPQKRSLVILFSQHVGFPVVAAIGQGLLTAVREAGLSVTDMHVEYLDLERHPTPEHRAALTQLLQTRVRNLKAAIVFAQGQPALDYALNEGKTLFPGAALMTNVPHLDVIDRLQGRQMIHVPWRPDYAGTLRLAMASVPKARRAIVVVGGSLADRPYVHLARAELKPFEPQLSIEYTDRLPYAEMLARIQQAGPDTVVLVPPYFGDAYGVATVPAEVAKVMSERAPVPVFMLVDAYVGYAAVGGSVLSTEIYGERIGKLAIDYLRGDLRLPQQLTRIEPEFTPTFNWPQVQRWAIDPDRLPPGSVFLNRPPTLWTQYRVQVLAVAGAFTLMALQMLALAMQARKRRLAEQAAQASEARARVLTERRQRPSCPTTSTPAASWTPTPTPCACSAARWTS